MTKTFARWLEERTYILLLGTLIFSLVSIARPQAARAEGTHDGKFSAAANKTSTIYWNLSTVEQTVLASVCVTTAPSGTLSVAVEDRLSDGTTPSLLANVKFGQCTSIAYLLPATHIITVRSPGSAASAGTYTVSVQLNPPPPPGP
jgi:hypothetical protein